MKNLFKARWMTSLIFLVALFVITGIAAPGFLTYDNIVTCFNTATMYTLLAVGIAFVIMTGEIDVSIGATLGLTAGMTGLIAQQDGSIPKMLLLCLAMGAAIGLVNGVGVSYFGVPSLIFTLGTNSVVRGLIYIMSGGRTIENFGGAISSYGNKTVFAGVTLYYAIAVVLVAISHLVLTKTRKGKYFIAVGDNAGGANLVGISVLSTKILAYVLCGLFAGLGGFVFASKYGQVMTVAGNGYEMTAIAACVLGGISLSGGLGNVVGAAIGAVIMQDAINLMGSVVVAAQTAGEKIRQMFTLPMESVGMAMATYVGQNHGAGRNDRIKQGIRDGCLIQIVYSIAAWFVIWLIKPFAVGLVLGDADPAVTAGALDYLAVISTLFVILGFLMIFRNTLQGLGYSTMAVISGVGELIGRSFGGCLALHGLGFLGISLANPIAWGFALCYCVFMVTRMLRKEDKQAEK